jgi:hypothetical protein
MVYLINATGDKGIGGVEFYADVSVGRIPLYDEDENGALDHDVLDSILQKTIDYEVADVIQSTWRRNVLTSCPYVAMWDSTANDYTVAKYWWSEWLRDEDAPPPFWDWWRIYEQTYPDVTPDAEVHDGCSPAKTLAAWNDPNDPADADDADDGRGVVMWMTHGDQTSARKVFENALCQDLDDGKPSLVFMGACYNAKPEVTHDSLNNIRLPLAYMNLKSGAVGAIGATRTSYG